MLSIGAIGFAAPWLLLGLLALPVIWWLLRVLPETPRLQNFPPIRLLFELSKTEASARSTPWWLILLRMMIALALILALARPLFNPDVRQLGDGPMLLIIDDGWASGGTWHDTRRAARGLLNLAAREEQPVALLTTAPGADGRENTLPRLVSVEQARRQLEALKMKPWPVDRGQAATMLRAMKFQTVPRVYWLTDGLAGPDDAAFAAVLNEFGKVTVLRHDALRQAKVLRPGRGPVGSQGAGAFRLEVLRAARNVPETLFVRLSGAGGQLLARAKAEFAPGAEKAIVVMDLPAVLANEAVRLDIEQERTAAAVILLDERWRRRPVGLVRQAGVAIQPLLSDSHYLERALKPYTDFRAGGLGALLKEELAVIILPDQALEKVVQKRMRAWISGGGLLLRFAGPHLAQGEDKLTPVGLRRGGRAIGGAMSWSRPMKIAPFARSSPFHGLVVPEDVRVFRQVLAQPSIDLASRTWAQLRDGTPLVTARKIGDGWLVLFHASANAEWSSLPLSGLFVDMLRRVVDMARGVAGNESGDLPPLFSLDAQGGLRAPLPTALALPLDRLSEIEPGPRHPAGLYGRGDARRAFNLGARLAPPKNLTVLPKEAVVTGYDRHREVDLMPWILLAAFIAALLDLIAIVALKGLLPVVGGGAARAGGIALAVITATSIAVVAWPGASWSQERPMAKQPVNDDAWSIMASEKTRLAYILSGDKEVDAMSAAGLRGLSMVLTDRTAVEPAAPIGLDVERDDFVLFPFIYWPISARAPILSGPAVVRVKSYLRGGGMIMFDSRDAEFEAVGGDAGENRLWLKALLRRLDLPALVPVPANHVLTKSYYLLQSFPGRHAGGRVWVEKAGRHSKDGVSSVIIGSNDWASAWALGPSGRPLAALVSRHPRQREFAFRFGVNAVMYTLTGNYKADQVHVPAILERLGN